MAISKRGSASLIQCPLSVFVSC